MKTAYHSKSQIAAALALTAIVLILVALETTLLLKFRKSIFPYVWAEKLLLSLLTKTMWLGGKLGISKDRVGNSFIKAHNLMVKSHAHELNTDTFLILLPRCLEKEAKRQVVERANGRAVQVVTAGGGEEARKAIAAATAAFPAWRDRDPMERAQMLVKAAAIGEFSAGMPPANAKSVSTICASRPGWSPPAASARAASFPAG